MHKLKLKLRHKLKLRLRQLDWQKRLRLKELLMKRRPNLLD